MVSIRVTVGLSFSAGNLNFFQIISKKSAEIQKIRQEKFGFQKNQTRKNRIPKKLDKKNEKKEKNRKLELSLFFTETEHLLGKFFCGAKSNAEMSGFRRFEKQGSEILV